MYEYTAYKPLLVFDLHYFKIVYSYNVPAVLQSQCFKYEHTRVTKTFYPNKVWNQHVELAYIEISIVFIDLSKAIIQYGCYKYLGQNNDTAQIFQCTRFFSWEQWKTNHLVKVSFSCKSNAIYDLQHLTREWFIFSSDVYINHHKRFNYLITCHWRSQTQCKEQSKTYSTYHCDTT